MRTLAGGDIEAGTSSGHVSDTERETLHIEAPESSHMNVIDIDEWASSLERILEDVPHFMCRPAHPSNISRLPGNLRDVDKKAYEPCYLSVGPYHHDRPSLQRMEKTKLVILKCFLQQMPELVLTDIVREIKSIEHQARSFYTDVAMDSEKFVQMLLLDSLYLLIFFCGMPKGQGRKNYTNTKARSSIDNQEVQEGIGSTDDSMDRQIMSMLDQSNDEINAEDSRNGPAWLWSLLVHDLFLLENQLPFFVLQKMHDLVYDESETTLIVVLKSMFQGLLLDYVKRDSEMVIGPNDEIHHLLHLCHMFFRPTHNQDFTTCKHFESSQMFRLGSAVQLYEAGVAFEASPSSAEHSLLDITFSSSGKMAMPCLHVDDNTNSLLRNLIGLEQMKFPRMGLDFSAYAVLLLHLVTSPADVKLLRRKGIIQHHLASDKEMMLLINRLSVGLAFDYMEDQYSLKPVFHELKKFSSKRVPRWRASLKHKYFKNPWTLMSLLAASLLLLLSALQTYYAVYSYYHPYYDGKI